MDRDIYAVCIKIASFGDAVLRVGGTSESRDFALIVYGEIRKNYSLQENISLIMWENGSENPKDVVLSDIEKKALGIKE